MPVKDGIYYTQLGAGPEIILVHALGLNSSMWSLQVPLLAQRYRITRFDVRGHGRSEYNGKPFDIGALAGDVENLMDGLGIERAALVGVSMGGVIAQYFAANYPERTAAAVLCSTVAKYGEEARKSLLDRAELAEREGMESLVEPTVNRWFTQRFLECAQQEAEATRDAEKGPSPAATMVDPTEATLLSAVRGMLQYTNPNGYAAAARALAAMDLTGELGKIKCPTMIISGDQDPGVPSDSQEVLAGGIGKSIPLVLPNTSHMIPLESAREFNGNILNFLAWANHR